MVAMTSLSSLSSISAGASLLSTSTRGTKQQASRRPVVFVRAVVEKVDKVAEKADKIADKATVDKAKVDKVADKAAPNSEVVSDDVLNFVKTLPGITQPFPNIFDPADILYFGLVNIAQPIRELRRWRESEITHGRVAMLATVGFLVGEQLDDFPLLINVDGHITGPAIGHFQQVEARGAIFWVPFVFVVALCEAYRIGLGWNDPVGDNLNTLRDDYECGNLGFDPLGLLPSDPAGKKRMQAKELNNGRLAMIAIAGFVAQELVSGEEIFTHLFKRFGWA